jgi:phosphomannomutase
MIFFFAVIVRVFFQCAEMIEIQKINKSVDAFFMDYLPFIFMIRWGGFALPKKIPCNKNKNKTIIKDTKKWRSVWMRVQDTEPLLRCLLLHSRSTRT